MLRATLRAIQAPKEHCRLRSRFLGVVVLCGPLSRTAGRKRQKYRTHTQLLITGDASLPRPKSANAKSIALGMDVHLGCKACFKEPLIMQGNKRDTQFLGVSTFVLSPQGAAWPGQHRSRRSEEGEGVQGGGRRREARSGPRRCQLYWLLPVATVFASASAPTQGS